MGWSFLDVPLRTLDGGPIPTEEPCLDSSLFQEDSKRVCPGLAVAEESENKLARGRSTVVVADASFCLAGAEAALVVVLTWAVAPRARELTAGGDGGGEAEGRKCRRGLCSLQ